VSTRREVNLETWLNEFAARTRDTIREDVHIDELDARYRDRHTWLRGGVECLSSAASRISAHRWRITPAMEFFIEPSGLTDEVSAVNLAELSSRWSHTPPALTVYRCGNEPWKADTAFKPIQVELNDDSVSGLRIRAYFQEWFDDADQVYDKRLWLVVE